jgi:hypothetical protein
MSSKDFSREAVGVDVTAIEVIDSLPVDGWILEEEGMIRFRDLSGVSWCPLQLWTNKLHGYLSTAKDSGVDWDTQDEIMLAVDSGEARKLRQYMMKRWGLT